MVKAKRVRGGKCNMALSGELTIYNAAVFKEEFMPHLEKCKSLIIDLSEVSEIDTSCFQLLIQAKRELEAQGKPVELVSHSAAVLEILSLYGQEDYFGDPLILTVEKQTKNAGQGAGT